MRHALPRFFCVASLANVAFFPLWALVLDPATGYFLDGARPWRSFAAVLVLFASLCAIGALGVAICARLRARVAMERLLLIAASIALLNTRFEIADLLGGAAQTFLRTETPVTIVVATFAAALALCGLLPASRRQRIAHGTYRVFLALSPLLVVTVGQTLFLLASDLSHLEPVTAATLPRIPGPRVVVVVLDEWDQFLTFEDRRPGDSFPAIDRLVGESVHFTRAEAPSMVTELAIPSILTGRRVVATADKGSSDRVLFFEDGTAGAFSSTPTVLSVARQEGRNVGLAGWYHPYCRVLGSDLSRCVSRAIRPAFNGSSLVEAVRWHGQTLFETLPHARKLERMLSIREARRTSVEWHEESWRSLHAAALAMVGDSTLDLVFVHYSLPHAPWLTSSGWAGNLALADACLGEVVTSIDESAVSESTTLIVLSDHPKRRQTLAPADSARLLPGESRPVPMIVRLPMRGPIIDQGPLSTLLLHDMVLEILRGALRDPDALVRWVEERSGNELLKVSSDAEAGTEETGLGAEDVRKMPSEIGGTHERKLEANTEIRGQWIH